jgi:hypothetical protein
MLFYSTKQNKTRKKKRKKEKRENLMYTYKLTQFLFKLVLEASESFMKSCCLAIQLYRSSPVSFLPASQYLLACADELPTGEKVFSREVTECWLPGPPPE